jgi:hypothetical protein
MDRTERQRLADEVRAHRKQRRAEERQARKEQLAYEHGKLDFSRRQNVERAPYRNGALLAQWRRGWEDARIEWERWQASRITDAAHRAHLQAQIAKVRADCGFADLNLSNSEERP